jgi:hypothetical protein
MHEPHRSLSEQLSQRLSRLAAQRVTLGAQRQCQLRDRRQELLAAASSPEPDLAALTARAAAVTRQVAERQEELASLSAALRAAEQREVELGAELARGLAELRFQCEELLAGLPLLAEPARRGWIAWLTDWHQLTQRAFEPQADWRVYYGERGTVAAAVSLASPAVERIRLLEVGEDGEEVAPDAGLLSCEALSGKIEREQAEIDGLQRQVAGRIAAVAPLYGRIVADLPDPFAAGSPHEMQRLEGLLISLEATLGRFTASARMERQMLEVLA